MSNKINNYGWNSGSEPLSCNYIAPYILKKIDYYSPRRIVDIGSGNGSLCGLIKKKNYYVCGIEYDKEGVEISKKNYPNINFYHYGVQDDPNLFIKDENSVGFDLVVSTEVVEHLYSPQLLIQYANAVLNKNGKLVITTPYHGYIKNLALSLFNKWDNHHTVHWEGGHIKFWSFKTLGTLIEENGFKVIDKGGVGRIPYLWKSMVIVAEKYQCP